jgi:hypothetical protein
VTGASVGGVLLLSAGAAFFFRTGGTATKAATAAAAAVLPVAAVPVLGPVRLDAVPMRGRYLRVV